jgi:hypothetical protein
LFKPGRAIREATVPIRRRNWESTVAIVITVVCKTVSISNDSVNGSNGSSRQSNERKKSKRTHGYD